MAYQEEEVEDFVETKIVINEIGKMSSGKIEEVIKTRMVIFGIRNERGSSSEKSVKDC